MTSSQHTFFLFAGLIFFNSFIFGQNKFISDENYLRLTSKASVQYQGKEYLHAGQTYDTAFQSIKGTAPANDLYDAACSWARAQNADKAFYYLNKAAQEGKWSALGHTTSDTDLSGLHSDPRWQPLIDIISRNKVEKEIKMNKPLAAILDSIYTADQEGRLKLNNIGQQYGWSSPQMDSLWKIIGSKDSIDLIRVKDIIGRYGWLGPQDVGERGSMALFLVIQHSDSLDWATYLPAMQEAVKKGNANPQDLALLEDRLSIAQGKPQRYGSQVRTDSTGKSSFNPIFDEPNVNKRRAAMGLGPLEDYAKYFGIDYHLPVSAPSGKKL
jgi:uncharacterized protein DUF6624